MYGLKRAFTMLELVMVIVVIGIIAALAIPRFERDRVQEAADNILSAIRYTQHLALLDDKTDPADSQWQKKLWKISFTNSGTNSYYTISYDEDKDGHVDKAECTIDPANGKYMYHLNTNPVQADESENVLIGKRYGVKRITTAGGCSAVKHIGFDRLGRPHVSLGSADNIYSSYMRDDCNITFEIAGVPDEEANMTITIMAETGYAYIVGRENL